MMETSYDRRALVLWFRRCSEAPNCGGAPAGKAESEHATLLWIFSKAHIFSKFWQNPHWPYFIFTSVENAYICIALAYIILFSSGIVTYKALKVSRASAAVRKIQKNIFMSLVVSTITHLGLLFIPLATFFMLSLLVPEWSKSSIVKYTSDFMVIMIQQHGAVSAVTMFLTNNLLRRTAKQLFYTEMS
ncbi:Serpentine Receptor, class H [Caenorhabditis elegans]|uniref:Serpentine Receptor, class H n=1 Tax=Caenorhabditis elegans TaxID=6239 RepID=A0A0K3AUP2_CAEEL|nr:Serpentine Receptor, class H [Caenorhabditis elegans]CTQ86740.1 Serpentine Receptor, class H [Caenorhabditis elegans]|eukprot:NP_001300041.1 Serpentine Receptor, class H [Caenorhabditis elegans]